MLIHILRRPGLFVPFSKLFNLFVINRSMGKLMSLRTRLEKENTGDGTMMLGQSARRLAVCGDWKHSADFVRRMPQLPDFRICGQSFVPIYFRGMILWATAIVLSLMRDYGTKKGQLLVRLKQSKEIVRQSHGDTETSARHKKQHYSAFTFEYKTTTHKYDKMWWDKNTRMMGYCYESINFF